MFLLNLAHPDSSVQMVEKMLKHNSRNSRKFDVKMCEKYEKKDCGNFVLLSEAKIGKSLFSHYNFRKSIQYASKFFKNGKNNSKIINNYSQI